jgi:hypothetical protein
MGRDGGGRIDQPESLTVRFPQLPVVAYLRLMAWSSRAAEAIVADAALESVARANGVNVLDRATAHLSHRCASVFAAEAAKAVRAGHTTMAPEVAAPLRLWRESLTTYERANEWIARMSRGTSPIPAPTRDVETTQKRLADALRSAFEITG